MRTIAWIPLLLLCALWAGLAFRIPGVIGRLPGRAVTGTVERAASAQPADTLYVLIHGYARGAADTWANVTPLLRQDGDVMVMDYPAGLLSTADPMDIARIIDARVERQYRNGRYARVVLVGYSLGALIARRTFLLSTERDARQGWAHATERIVLAAGMNRGWEVDGIRTLDISLAWKLWTRLGSWLGRGTGLGGLILSAEVGAPFVANLRIDWMNHFRGNGPQPMIVQLLGDIDDRVSEEDSKDMGAVGASHFYWLKVRGADHLSVIRFDGDFGRYRRDKFMAAIHEDASLLARQSEERQPGTDPNVRHLVFVLHGIRDLGPWSAGFEQEIKRRLAGSADLGEVRLVSPRYGYFSAGAFLLLPDRQRLVRWFVDEYTEILARYPNVQTIDFFGHSNGTYLLAHALSDYDAIRIRRLVLAGSVLPQRFDWSGLLGGSSPHVQELRNYVASDDWVVALLPRVFEQPATRWMHNDVGSAGFNGFLSLPELQGTQNRGRSGNVRYLEGGHSAFSQRIPEIVGYFLDPDSAPSAIAPTLPDRADHQGLAFFSHWLALPMLCGFALWIFYAGFLISGAARQFFYLPLAAYAVLVIWLLDSF